MSTVVRTQDEMSPIRPLPPVHPYVADGELRDRYPQVAQFGIHMRRELFANRGKGERTVWVKADPKDLTYDAAWHLIKLMAALKDNDPKKIVEHAADTANMAMMVVDASGMLLC